MPKYLTEDGVPTTAADPDRAVWYAHGCGTWTDDWDHLKTVGPGIPVCPTCGAPGFLTPHHDWENGVLGYDDGHPGYAAFVAANKGRCLRAAGGFAAAWEASRPPAGAADADRPG